ncbi:MAG: 30S ribosomal protein S7 [Candidatus Falkowbacteria bacterium GW2011_GWD2_38_42]|uniref:Small ribosomal subunit protein uS7 n=1 Tax=Candidatus Falkowbacteria bacterium GW2011_GWE1_38_31 TaxID=1618638 RepID=A0A0G0JR18_9BACT|nr:MAG: 30S ribosomal protein S7 [Candidatus Falkowbacteria bacterium GW2011_GWF2_38_1205]KKQ63296.1 MAG: 30S ribosomal protein S7 [Candidatus Falkowbacteria bacterium GW2011_GWF1_38_22]KKQ65586.1 MAG: 30S ribosomal protein S7 [Candidatus Falkowbacteria bacterium GW2011_GWE2_38_254]KKQ70028.1 MAG: 30S ribosomal protein S7 [Candidatus Falkowbacteria bacterium GW2011_GWE1_38_31]KKQ72731.1 MAG: 30S ribosomal protein S7 [Candidatus Falkowbacteria bacterium GW2011_GWD2_38_42]
MPYALCPNSNMRGKQAPKRKIEGDIRYNDTDVAKFINYIMQRGKKTVAQGIVYDAFDIIKEDTKQDPRHVFNKALKKVSPLLEVRGKRVGGANYQIPYQVRGERRFALGSRWLIEAAKDRKGKPMRKKLADEIIAASAGEGAAMRKKETVHKMAESNRAFAHFAR